MRTIKYRGKRLDNGEWVYGYLFKLNHTELEGKIYIIPDFASAVYYYEVDPETIGQYTGLKDKNGKEIYEKDIVTGIEYPFIDDEKQNYVGIVVFYENATQFGYEYKCVNKNKKGISDGINNEFEANENLICENLEVIGNTTDNPKLLEV